MLNLSIGQGSVLLQSSGNSFCKIFLTGNLTFRKLNLSSFRRKIYLASEKAFCWTDLYPCQHTSGWDREVEVADHLRCWCTIDGGQPALWHFIRVHQLHPVLGVHNGCSFLNAWNIRHGFRIKLKFVQEVCCIRGKQPNQSKGKSVLRLLWTSEWWVHEIEWRQPE